MKRMILAVAAVLLCSGVARAERYRVKDQGGFGTTGRFIEFSDRYGWASYELDFSFGLDERRLTDGSNLLLTIRKKDGSRWSYRCMVDDDADKREMWANVNMLYGKGVSVLTECRLAPRKFAKAVGLDYDLVGEPTLVFHVMIKDGQARPGLQKGLYFLTGGQIEASALNQYSSQNGDPSELGVLFASAAAALPHHAPLPLLRRFIP